MPQETPPESQHFKAEHHAGRLAADARTVSAVTLLSRFAGLAREVLTARIFGDTAIGSAFAAGFQAPNLFRRLFGEGALSAAFIPEYTTLDNRDPRLASRFALRILSWLLLLTVGITILAEIALLVALVALPANPGRDLSLRLIMLMLPYMPLVCLAAVLGGMLQVHGRFAASSAGPVLMNAMVVAVGLYFLLTGRFGDARVAYLLGAVIVLSGITQVWWFARLLRPHLLRGGDDAAAAEAGARTMKRFVPAAIGLGTLQINTFLDTLLAMWPIWVGPTVLGFAYPMDASSNVLLAAAQRLYQFPLGVFGIAVATAIFPMLSRHAAQPAAFLHTLRRGIRLSLFIGIPASVGLFMVRLPAIAVPFSGGSTGFSAQGVERSAAVLGGFALAIWAYSLNHVLTRAFYANGDTKTPMRLAVAMVVLNFLLNVLLMWPLREAGLAYSTAITAGVQVLILLVLANRFAPPGESLADRHTMLAIARIALAAGAMAMAVWAAQHAVSWGPGWLGKLGSLAAAVIVGGWAFLGAAAALRCQELRWLTHRRTHETATTGPTHPNE
ncbi:MAG: murein biosynthesis integral membrane protein MurJ [Phycisphaerales bacterium]